MKLRQNEAKWIEAQNRWQINVTSEDGKRKTFCSATGAVGKKGKLEAERKADEWLESNLRNKTAKVEDAFGRFIDHLKMTTSASHWKPYESIGKNWILPHYGSKKISALTEGDCERAIAYAFEAGKSKKYLTNIRGCISSFLKFCRKNKLSTLMPEELRIPSGAKESQRFTLTEEEIRVLFSPCEWRYIHMYRFLLLSDLRPGELIGLKWEDFDGDCFTVNRAINTHGGITAGKNHNAHRTLKLTPLAAEEIQAQRDMLKAEGLVSPWAFPTSKGNPVSQNKLRAYWRDYCERMQIGRRIESDGAERYITPYEFRHTCYSVNKDMPTTLKKMAFGHSRNFDGDRVYNHEMEGDRERIAEYSQEAFSRILAYTTQK